MARGTIVLGIVLGSIMTGLGLLILVRLIAFGGVPLSPSIWLDLLFAAFFLLRGGMHLRTAIRVHRRTSGP